MLSRTLHQGDSDRKIDSSAFLPTPSIVIEWENAELSGLGRAAQMLAQLCSQLKELQQHFVGKPEIIILYHEDIIDGSKLENMIGEAGSADGWPAEIRILPAPEELKYYSMKNHGFRLANHEVIVFLDSDVIPEKKWLARLLSILTNTKVHVACGEAYIEPDNWYTRAFALFWFFPARTSNGKLERTSRFYANNVAFRREVFAAHPFPESKLFRGQCALLAKKLQLLKFVLVRDSRAKVSHPPPNGLYHFFARALCNGSDCCERMRWSRSPTVRSALLELQNDFQIMSQRISSRKKQVNANGVDVAVAFSIGALFYVSKFAGYLVSLAKPELVSRYFEI